MSADRRKIEAPLENPVQHGRVILSPRNARMRWPKPPPGADRLTSERAPRSSLRVTYSGPNYVYDGPASTPGQHERAALFALLARRRQHGKEKASEAELSKANTRAVRLFMDLTRAARGEIVLPDASLPDVTPEIAREALESNTADIVVALRDAIRANQARHLLEQYDARLTAIFRRAKGGEKTGVTDKQARAWILNEMLDEGNHTGATHKHEGGRIFGIDPTSFQELVGKADRKLRPEGRAEEVRKILAEAAQVRANVQLSDQEYDNLIGPTNRKGGRGIELVRAEAPPERDKSKTTRGGVRTAARKVRYGPGDRDGDD